MARAIHPSELIDPDFESMIQSYCERNEQAKVTSSAAGTSVLILETTLELPGTEALSQLKLQDIENLKASFKRRQRLPGV